MEFAVVYFHDFLLQLLLPALLVVNRTLVVLGKSVAVAVHEAALALNAQQTHFLVAVETSLAVLLLLVLGL